MRASQWREKGYLVTFRSMHLPGAKSGAYCVIMLHKELKTCWATPVSQGKWMSHDCLTDSPWLALHSQPWFQGSDLERRLLKIQQVCYCSSLGNSNCDFCGNVRIP